MNIRPAQPKDAEQNYEVFKQTWLATYPNEENNITVYDVLSRYPIENREATIEKYSNFYEKINNNPDEATTLVWVAEKGDKIMGLITIDKMEPIKIGAIYVLPEFQGKGVGKALIEYVIEKYGKSDLQLNVAKYNAKAIDFYKKQGFESVGDVNDPNGALPSGKVIPEIKMIRKSLK